MDREKKSQAALSGAAVRLRGAARKVRERLRGGEPKPVSFETWLKSERLTGPERLAQRAEFDRLRADGKEIPLIAVSVQGGANASDAEALRASLRRQTWPCYAPAKAAPDADYCLRVGQGTALSDDALCALARVLRAAAAESAQRPGAEAAAAAAEAAGGSAAVGKAAGGSAAVGEAAGIAGQTGAMPDLIYFDIDFIGADGKRQAPQFKPEYDPLLLAEYNYIGRTCLVRRGLKELTPHSRVYRIPRILAHVDASRPEEENREPFAIPVNMDLPGMAPAEETAAAEVSSPDEEKLSAKTEESAPHADSAASDNPKTAVSQAAEAEESRMPVWIKAPAVPRMSVIIPNRDHAEDLRRCTDSLRRFGPADAELIIVENGSTEEATFALYRKLEREGARVLNWEHGFNYAAINNFAARRARGRLLLLLNNDTELTDRTSLEAMAALAERPDIGAVGAQLLYPDGAIQHAGVILGCGGIAGHALQGQMAEDLPQYVRAITLGHRHSVCAVTAACLMIRKEAFAGVGGFDEAYEVTFNDVDLCLRLKEQGLRNCLEPAAVLIHYESRSRGTEDTPGKVARFHREIGTFVRRWKDALLDGDPWYDPNLTLSGPAYTCRDTRREKEPPCRKYIDLAGKW